MRLRVVNQRVIILHMCGMVNRQRHKESVFNYAACFHTYACDMDVRTGTMNQDVCEYFNRIVGE